MTAARGFGWFAVPFNGWLSLRKVGHAKRCSKIIGHFEMIFHHFIGSASLGQLGIIKLELIRLEYAFNLFTLIKK